MDTPLHQSEINTWLSCRRKHTFMYREGLKPQRKSLALSYGSAFHRGLALWYSGKDKNEVLAVANEVFDDDDEMTEYPDEWSEKREFLAASLRGHLTAYMTNWPQTEWAEVVAVEHSFEVMIEDVPIAGIVDGIVKDQHGYHWLLEHKTAGSLEAPFHLSFDLQVSFYLLAMRALEDTPMENGTPYPHVVGVLYNVCRKPGIRPLSAIREIVFNTGESMTGTKTAAKARARAEELRIVGETTRTERIDEFENRTSGTILKDADKYFMRDWVNRGDTYLDEFAGTVKRYWCEIRVAAGHSRNLPNWHSCKYCPFKDICGVPVRDREEMKLNFKGTGDGR